VPDNPTTDLDSTPELASTRAFGRRALDSLGPRRSGLARLAPNPDPRAAATLGRLGSLVTVLRWASLLVGLVLIPITDTPASGEAMAFGAVLVAGETVYRTLRPLRLDPATWQREALLLLDLAITVVAIGATGQLASPFLLTPLPVVILAAYGWGYREGFAAAVLTGGSIALVDFLAGASPEALRTGVLAAVVVVLAALVGGFTRQLWIDSERRRQETLDQMTRMSVANDLLHALHDVVQTLPASLDLSDVVASARRRFRDLFAYTSMVVLVHDDAATAWRVELAEGVRLPVSLADRDLPPLVMDAARGITTHLVDDTDALGTGAFLAHARSALVTPLRARDHVIGIVALEHLEPDAYTTEDANLLRGLAGSLALAVDNARWFGRLRTLGAEAERARIARDLHDRIAQSLAYVGFELDRLSTASGEPELRELHQVVRDVVAELRETLYQLRTTVTEEQGLRQLAAGYVRRWSERTGIPVVLEADDSARRLPLQVEQELWRILQEALTNVERHADAEHAWVRWHVDSDCAALEVRDDGRGIDDDGIDRDRFGLLGIRERADAVGARLTLDSGPGQGTRILVELEVAR
jgi:signal transduction histidine kinase